MAENTNSKKERRADSRVLKRRRRNVLLIMGELALCLVLGIGAVVCQRTVNRMQAEELGPDFYTEAINQKTVEPATSMSKSIEEVTNESGDVIDTKEIDIPVYTDTSEYRNFLILGVDTRPDNPDLVNTDVIIIASLNNTTGEVKLVSVLRDTILRMEDGTRKHSYDKANQQYYSGITDTVSMINRNLGLDIREYCIVNWYGVCVCINQVGGIDMEIKDEKQLEWHKGYLRSVCEATGFDYESEVLWRTGMHHMDGPQVLALCRIRYGGLNDTGRTANQREAIGKILEAAKAMAKRGEYTKLLNVAETALSNIKTNMTLPEIIFYASDIGRYTMAGSRQFPVQYTSHEVVGNYMDKYRIDWPIVADNFEQEVRDLHAYLFPDLAYEPSEFIKTISWQMYLDRTGQ
ncbi:MAG: LCP family protein [Lachnospiraceae bacterium]|nr:LCP family protein [Lachnospiraceae bacterium]